MGFRSRGIKIDFSTNELSEKEYHDPVDSVYKYNRHITLLSQQMQLLEFAIKGEDEIDSINFHTGCKPIDSLLTMRHDGAIKEKICQIFDGTYKLYTLGIRFKNRQIVAESIYYYPTVWKINRYGICGQEKKEIIQEQIKRFAEELQLNISDRKLLYSFIPLIKKFKGICITTDQYQQQSYKLYFRMNEDDVRDFFKNYFDYEKFKLLYSDTVLIALRITGEKITGCNLYYLK